MTDPYQVLGVSPNASDETRSKTHIENLQENTIRIIMRTTFGWIWLRKRWKEITRHTTRFSARENSSELQLQPRIFPPELWLWQPELIQRQSGRLFSVCRYRQLLNANRISDAEELLEGIPSNRRDAEWYYLRGRVFYVRGWLDQAYSYYVRANQMNPANPEYKNALNQLMWQRNTGRPAGNGYGDYRNVQYSGCSGCDMCSGLICADCCCECMGGDLISCC